MEIAKIVLTGGPCAGKTTAMSWIQSTFTRMGYTVLFVPETATELITNGVSPWTCGSRYDYQKCHLQFQLAKEKVFTDAAKTMNNDKILIVCDRAALDSKVYVSASDFERLLKETGLNEVELRDSYDAVFHLVTTAKGAEDFYTTSNNAARTETLSEAVDADDRQIAAWTGHPHLRIIDNSTDFEGKMKRLVSEISSFLGEPEPYEIERKFLVEYPDIDWLNSLPNCQRVEIVQTYLKSPEGEEIRIRQRSLDGHYVYFRTAKRRISDMKRVEVERRLTRDEYLQLLMSADASMRQIRKDRYCLTYDNQYFEIDIYPFWNDKAIAEIELNKEAADIRFPKELKIIREVTGNEAYTNYSLAQINKATAL